jgi:ABC-type dipeptide/oligopeptide/nickel transport system ATPase component
MSNRTIHHTFPKSRSVVEYNVTYPRDPANRNQIANEIARAITSKYNQHITLLIVGQPGSGKSWAAMDLAYQAAYAVSRIVDGKYAPDGTWQKYFSIDNMAIVTLDRVTNLMKHMRQYGIYILDDIGVGYSARDWQKSKNRKLNEIIQTFRTSNNCTIFTVPDRFLIDKVPRSLVEKYMEFEKSEQLFNKRGGYESVNVYKYFNITSMKRDNKQFFTYLKDTLDGSNQYVRHIANKPPARLTIPYEKIRFEVAQELRIMNAELIEKEDAGEEDAPAGGGGGRKVSPEVQMKRELEVQKVTFIDQLIVEGKTIHAACDMVGIPRSRYKSLKKGDMKWFDEWKGSGGGTKAAL